MSNIEKFKQLSENFLKDIDDLIKENIESLTCHNIFEIYQDLFDKLKEFKGTSSGFTGFSEFLIFRSFIHVLGGKFTEKKDNKTTTTAFIMDKYILEPGHRKKFANYTYEPDLLIMDKNNTILGLIEIKIYPTDGVKTINKTVEKFTHIREEFKNAKALFIIFNYTEKQDKELERIESENRDWFKYIILQGTNNLFKDELNNYLKMFNWS